MITKVQASKIRLSENFIASEWLASADFPDVAASMEMPIEYLYKLRLMAATILQPIRDKMGHLTILSGFRSEELNRRVGGEATSQHLLGEAADIVCLVQPAAILARVIVTMLPHSYGQVILYLDKNDKSNFLHVSLPQLRPKPRELLINRGGKFMQWSVAIGFVKDAIN